MILHEINSKMPIYKDCTLYEVLVVGVLVFVTMVTFLSVTTKLIFGFASIGMVITLIAFFHTTQYFLARLQKMKYGKPYGYYWQLIIKQMIDYYVITGLYVTRVGKWSTRREK